MLFAYGAYQDLRILDEMSFWKQQEAEHIDVILELMKDLEPKFKETALAWKESFTLVWNRVASLIETVIRMNGKTDPTLHRQIVDLARFSLEQSQRFLNFLHELRTNSKPVQNNPVIVTVINHIARESEYFIGVLRALK